MKLDIFTGGVIFMAFGGFYKGEKKKPKKSDLEKRAQRAGISASILPQVEIIKKGKKEW